MIRKLILSAVVATGTLTGLTASASSAEAAPPVPAIPFHRHFEVLVECGHRWEVRGSYYDRHRAERVARHLRHEGFRVQIREC
jgi:hypothetical protein